jgi:lipoprotein-anchoring transpeptidase ErfK/SrfK
VAAAGCAGGADAPEQAVAPPATTSDAPTSEAPTSAPASEAPTVAPARPAAAAPRCRPGSYRRLRTPSSTPAAVVIRPAATTPTPGGPATGRFGVRNVNGVPTVLGVLGARVHGDCSPAWYRVQLPTKPNGATGWIRAGDVRLGRVRARILVDLSDRRVTLFRSGRPVFSTRAAVGAPATPTPTGAYYVNQRLVPSDPGGPFGPGAIGISAFSEVLTGWTQGGPIAIHGTNRPELIGRAVSNGCIRVRNDALRRLWRETLAGTPVVVRA